LNDKGVVQTKDRSYNMPAAISTSNLLGTAFIILKLCGVIDWSWWWVTAPIWAPLALLILILIGVVIYAMFTEGGKR